MLPASLAAAVEKDTPKLNPSIAKGLAVEHVAQVETYLDSVFKAVAPGFPPGLKYIGYRRLTPKEELIEVSKPRNNRRAYDIALSSVYMAEYKFSYAEVNQNTGEIANPVEFTKIMYLPYVNEAGTMYISGSKYVVSPVLADRVFEALPQGVFVRILKARLRFNRATHTFNTNNGIENQQVIWCKVHNEEAKFRSWSVKCFTTLVHYLIGKYGFTKAFSKFLGFVPVVGTQETITEEHYPKDEWVICYTTGIKPRRVKSGYYKPTPICLAVKKSDFNDPVAKQFIAGLFYVLDHFPDTMRIDLLDATASWRVMLGRIIWGDDEAAGVVLNNINEHFNSLDDYIDKLSAIKLEQVGFPVNDFYELFVVIMRNFVSWMANAPDSVATMYSKELSILPFICYTYIGQINNLIYKLISNRQRALTLNRVQELFSKHLKMGLVFSLSRECGLLSSAALPGDCYALGLTNLLIPQAASNKTRGRPRPNLHDPAKQLHVSIAEVGAYSAMPKSAPDGRQRINLCVKIDAQGNILRNPDLVDLIDKTKELIVK